MTQKLVLAGIIAVGLAACGVEQAEVDESTTLDDAVSRSTQALSITAKFDSVLKIPKCSASASVCDTGSTVYKSSTGAEPNGPNTLQGACADRLNSTPIGLAEEVYRLRIATLDGQPLARGRVARIDVDFEAGAFPLQTKVELFYASDLSTPGATQWNLIAATTAPAGTSALGVHRYTAYTTIPNVGGAVHAIRASVREDLFNAAAAPCAFTFSGDRDDLSFVVDAAPADLGTFGTSARMCGPLNRVGPPQAPQCGTCQATVCAAVPHCCTTDWSSYCASQAQLLCGVSP